MKAYGNLTRWTLLSGCFLFATAIIAAPARGESDVVVILNSGSGVQTLAASDLKRIYQGKVKSLPGVGVLKPADLPGDAPARAKFSQMVLGKNVGAVQRAYMKRALAGRGHPPKEVVGSEEMLSFVAENPGAIGYLPAAAAKGGVTAIGLDQIMGK